PDMGSGAHEMAIIYGETHNPESVTGKPVEVGGLPGRREATGRGVATVALAAAAECLSKPIDQTRIAVQGFGNVGSWTCRFLSGAGAKIIAVTELTGGVYNEAGIDIAGLSEYHQQSGTLAGYGDSSMTNEQLLALDVDILIPAACGHVITAENADRVNARMIVEGANAPTTPEADEILKTKDIPIMPDILANSGGVIASYVEWRRAKSGSMTKIEETYETVDSLVLESLESVTQLAGKTRASYREAALALAVEQVIKAMTARGWI
ncbi:MAG: glutamate dehydrogenase, partial [Candidatus Latescibacterota bacterium]